MKGTRKRHPVSFKARVALEAAKQTRTLAELAKIYQVHLVQISKWKKQFLISNRSVNLIGIEDMASTGIKVPGMSDQQSIQAQKGNSQAI